jgi:hypothetical protein
MSRFVARRPKNLWRTSASAISVPITVAISVVRAASSSETISASFSSASAKAFCQYSSVKPPSSAKLSRSLGVSPNEKIAITAIGISM